MSERTCIATGQTHPRHNLLRFVTGPDGAATLDLAEKLPGRGAWIIADMPALRTAVKKGQFVRAIGAAFGDIDDEVDRIKTLIRGRVIAHAGMARRAGLLIGGSGKLLAEGQCDGLLVATDASPREAARLKSKLGVEWTSSMLTAIEIGQVFGRESMAFAGLRVAQHAGQGNFCRNLHQEILRMERFYTSAGCNLRPDGCIT
jgi:predicted RNA-binding protein YlxR (DUF448 family)